MTVMRDVAIRYAHVPVRTRAQERGFVAGRELDDWLAAEAEVSGYFLEQEPTAAELH